MSTATQESEGVAGADHRDRTFILTDLKGSTDLHRRFPDQMLGAMDRHDAAILDLAARHRGEVFKNTGDGAWLAFDDPDDAVEAAIDIQREVPLITVADGVPLVLRVGVGTGPARPRRGDYFGPALNRTARLEGAANGGQVLVDETTRHRCTRHDFLDLGTHRFKGMDAFTVFQAVGDGLEREFGELQGKREADPGNLPAALTSFIGRRALLDEIRSLTGSGARIVTLTGPGGTGKSRLSVEAARHCGPAFDDGAWLVELSPLGPDHDVWFAFAATFSLPPVPGVTPRQQVLERLRADRALLVIDNCEHLVEAAAEAVLDILQASPGVVVLATSRQVLGLPGEALVPVPTLDEAGEHGGRSAAVELFIDRARLVSRRFDPSTEDEAIIVRICAALDHLPLAIEMAAANTRRVDLARILGQADSPIDLRSGRHRRAIGRQQTLRETLEWSYELLDDGVGELLDRLATFSGPFDEDLAIDLCARDDIDADEVVDAIDDLLDASLLTRDPADPDRFRLLHVVRAFGRERIAEAGRTEQLHRHHAEAFADRVRDLGARFDDGDEAAAARTLFTEQPDLEAAFERSLNADADTAAALTGPLFFFSYVHRGAVFGHWPARILEAHHDGVSHESTLCAMAAAHALHADAAPDDARHFLERGALADPDGDRSHGWLESVAGQLAFWSRQPEPSVAHHQRAVELALAADNSNCAIISASLAAFAAGRARRLDVAKEMLALAEQLADASRSPTPIGYVNFTKGVLLAGRRPDEALAELQIALDWAEVSANPQGANRVARVMADIRADGAPPAEALEIRANALVNFPTEGDAMHAWSTVQSLLPPLVALERFDEVAVLSGALDGSPFQGDTDVEGLLVDVRDRLGDETFDQLASEGRELGLVGTRRRIAERFASP